MERPQPRGAGVAARGEIVLRRAACPRRRAPGREPARTPPDTVVYAIGDIHGRCDLLEALQRGIRADAEGRAAKRRVLVYLGDYVSRGVDSRRTVELVRDFALPGFEVVPLKGNHEDLLLTYLGGNLAAGRHWFDFDGLDTLASYGVTAAGNVAHDDANLESLRRQFAAALPAEHFAFFRSLPAGHAEGGYYFAHGGVRPGVALVEQTERDRMWIRKAFLDSKVDHGAVVVHGHSIGRRPVVRPNRIGIDTGAYRSGVLTCLVLEGSERGFLQTGCAVGAISFHPGRGEEPG
jgi:serine/threonine protein phosphatase 1